MKNNMLMGKENQNMNDDKALKLYGLPESTQNLLDAFQNLWDAFQQFIISAGKAIIESIKGRLQYVYKHILTEKEWGIYKRTRKKRTRLKYQKRALRRFKNNL